MVEAKNLITTQAPMIGSKNVTGTNYSGSAANIFNENVSRNLLISIRRGIDIKFLVCYIFPYFIKNV